MSDLAIQVEGLGKRYRLSAQQPYKVLREALSDAAKNSFRLLTAQIGSSSGGTEERFTAPENHIWALKGVSFSVRAGEVVGIIGGNGAGKSTLLKILSRITEPTTGRVELHGRLGSLLEVGTGFHPELTGRENIFLNGAILGMQRREIARKFDDIVEFAEIERFLDTPVKRYSSGMYTRLAFAVAAHLDPEILLIDEVLAVGDADFQKKCLGKMGAAAHQGRTVLFVSHNMVAIQGLCRRVIWIHKGEIIADGPSSAIITRYLQTSFSELTEQSWGDATTAPGDGEYLWFHRVCARPLAGSPEDPMTIRTPIVLEFEYWSLRSEAYLTLSLELFNEQGILVFAASPTRDPGWYEAPNPPGLYRDRCLIPGDLLNDGTYRVVLYVSKGEGIGLLREEDILVFEVRDDPDRRGGWYGEWGGTVRPILDWTTERVTETSVDVNGSALGVSPLIR